MKAEEEPKAPKKAEKKADKEAKAEPKETKPAGKPSVPTPGPAPRLREKYFKTVVPALMKDFSYANSMKAPKLVKIVLNVGMGEAINDVKTLDRAVEEIGRITGQRPVVTRAKQSIATYKLRTGMPIGCMVTLRRGRMFEFLDRLISAALPRIRDFRGISAKSFDGRGNYSMGIKEQVIFPEIDIDKIGSIHGLDIAIVTSAATDEEGRALLTHLGMPFRK
ncbi:MAG TPA: 50S ribosomal protein L5 [Nitrospiraceae bacterium]|nr:50S ribosomal protein L5 [Nitrospiraceae bacterium]